MKNWRLQNLRQFGLHDGAEVHRKLELATNQELVELIEGKLETAFSLVEGDEPAYVEKATEEMLKFVAELGPGPESKFREYLENAGYETFFWIAAAGTLTPRRYGLALRLSPEGAALEVVKTIDCPWRFLLVRDE